MRVSSSRVLCQHQLERESLPPSQRQLSVLICETVAYATVCLVATRRRMLGPYCAEASLNEERRSLLDPAGIAAGSQGHI